MLYFLGYVGMLSCPLFIAGIALAAYRYYKLSWASFFLASFAMVALIVGAQPYESDFVATFGRAGANCVLIFMILAAVATFIGCMLTCLVWMMKSVHISVRSFLN